MNGIRNSPPSEVIADRISNLNEYFTYLIYSNVCRSLFERHKLLFSFILTTRIMQGNGSIDPLEWRFLISGQSPKVRCTSIACHGHPSIGIRESVECAPSCSHDGPP